MKKLAAAALSALILAYLLPAAAEDAANDIYIGDAGELCALSERVAGGDDLSGVSVYLSADIELKSPFKPIGASPETPFSGIFHGCGHSVSGLSVVGGDYLGLFGCVLRGRIDGLRLEGARACGNNYVALLAGRLYACNGGTAVTNCQVSGSVEGSCYAGGLVGYAGAAAYESGAGAEISGCSFVGTVAGDIYAGGIAGKTEARSASFKAQAALEDCVSRGSVSVRGRYGSLVGGICGAVAAESEGGSALASVSNCVSYASASAELAAAGGLCGAVGAVGTGASARVDGGFSFGNTAAAALSGGLAGKCEFKDGGSASVTGGTSAGNVTGGSVCVFAAGAGVSDCQSPASGDLVYPPGARPPVYLSGDADGDGVSAAEDAALLLQFDADLAVLGEAALKSCDINGDGAVDNLDAAALLKRAALHTGFRA